MRLHLDESADLFESPLGIDDLHHIAVLGVEDLALLVARETKVDRPPRLLGRTEDLEDLPQAHALRSIHKGAQVEILRRLEVRRELLELDFKLCRFRLEDSQRVAFCFGNALSDAAQL